MDKARAETAFRTEFDAGEVKGKGEIRNVGSGGLFVGTLQIPEEGEIVRVNFTSPEGEDVEVSGLVWWTTRDPCFGSTRSPGFGLQLLDTSETFERLVEKLLR